MSGPSDWPPDGMDAARQFYEYEESDTSRAMSEASRQLAAECGNGVFSSVTIGRTRESQRSDVERDPVMRTWCCIVGD
jgi:hypothetical protein